MGHPILLGIGTACPPRAPRREFIDWAVSMSARDEKQARVVRRLHEATSVERRGTVLLDPVEEGAAPAASRAYEFYPPWRSLPGGPTTAQRMAMYAAHAGSLAADACRGALRDAGVETDRVTHLIVATCTGFASPGVEHHLIRTLGLRRSVGQIGRASCRERV